MRIALVIIAVLTYGVALSIAVPTNPGALTPDDRSLVTSLLLLLGAVVLAAAISGALAVARGLVTPRHAASLPGGLRPATGGLLLARGALRPQHLLAMVVDLEQRGVVSSAPDQRRPGEWVFTLCDTQGPTISRAEYELLRLMFPFSAEGSRNTLVERLNEESARVLREALADEGHRLGLVRPRWRRRVQGVVFGLLIAVALAVPFAVPWLTAWTFNWVEAVAILVSALGVALGSAPGFTKRAGERVKNLLQREGGAAAASVPGPLARQPAWILVLTPAAKALPSTADDAGLGPLEPTPYHRDPGYRRRWNAEVGARLGGSGSKGRAEGREGPRWHLEGEVPAVAAEGLRAVVAPDTAPAARVPRISADGAAARNSRRRRGAAAAPGRSPVPPG